MESDDASRTIQRRNDLCALRDGLALRRDSSAVDFHIRSQGDVARLGNFHPDLAGWLALYQRGTTMTTAERVKQAYDIFRGGFKDPETMPHWDDAPSWVRDAVTVAYLQGKLDAPQPS